MTALTIAGAALLLGGGVGVTILNLMEKRNCRFANDTHEEGT